MADNKFVSGIFSVYDSREAVGFDNSDSYPIGLELIFMNDAGGRMLAGNLKKAFGKLSETNGIIFDKHEESGQPTINFDCFFKNTDALRKVLMPALDGIGLYHHDEQRVIPKSELLDRAKFIMSKVREAIAF